MIRPLTPDDLPAALALQAAGYPPFLHDGPEAFASRLSVAPQGCWAAVVDGTVAGYLISHPWASLAPPAPDVVLDRARGGVWYVHDLSVSEAARGTGLGRALLAAGRAAHPDLRTSELIAVAGAARYWETAGWRIVADLPADLALKVAAYGPDARYMTRALD